MTSIDASLISVSGLFQVTAFLYLSTTVNCVGICLLFLETYMCYSKPFILICDFIFMGLFVSLLYLILPFCLEEKYVVYLFLLHF